MPTASERRREGVVRYRTIKLPGGKYAHVAIVKKKGHVAEKLLWVECGRKRKHR